MRPGGQICTEDTSRAAPNRGAELPQTEPCGSSGGHGRPEEPGISRITLGPKHADACPVSATHPLGAAERIRVLVVDDNDGFRESLVFLLSGEDLEVVGRPGRAPKRSSWFVGWRPTWC